MAFADHIADVFGAFGPIQIRRMFSGYGLFREGLMFGLLHNETLYLKADAQNAAEFQELGLAQFTYARKSKVVRLSYYRAPDAVMDDSAEATKWAKSSFEAALREASTKTKKGLKARSRLAGSTPPRVKKKAKRT